MAVKRIERKAGKDANEGASPPPEYREFSPYPPRAKVRAMASM